MEKPGFFSTTQQGRNTDHFLFLSSFRCRDDDWSNDDESDSDFDNMHEHDEYSHSEIIQRCNFGSKHLINARLLTQTCLQHQPDSSTRDATPLCLNSTNFDGDQKTEGRFHIWGAIKTFFLKITMKFSGSRNLAENYEVLWVRVVQKKISREDM